MPAFAIWVSVAVVLDRWYQGAFLKSSAPGDTSITGVIEFRDKLRTHWACWGVISWMFLSLLLLILDK